MIFGTPDVTATATISECGVYRYTLSRVLRVPMEKGGTVLFIMLNPSIADGSVDDPTIRRCVGFAREWGFDELLVGNLFAYRSTIPLELQVARRAGKDIVGPDNRRHVREMAAHAALVVCAWGAIHPLLHPEARAMVTMLAGRRPHILGLTKDGWPRHPLYSPGRIPPLYWRHPELQGYS